MKDFIRNNAFLVSLAGMVVVLGTVVLVLRASQANKRDERIEQIQKKYNTAQRLKLVNDDMLAEQRRRNDIVEDEREAVERKLAGQGSDYPPIVVDVDGRSVAAFPYDEQTYEDLRLGFKVTDRYVALWDQWMDRLDRTRPASSVDAYYAQRIRHWSRVLLGDMNRKIDKTLELLNQAAITRVRNHISTLNDELDPIEADLRNEGYLTEDGRLSVTDATALPAAIRAKVRQHATVAAKMQAWSDKLTRLLELETRLKTDRQDIADARDALVELDRLTDALAAAQPTGDAERIEQLRQQLGQKREQYDQLAGTIAKAAEDRDATIAQLFDLTAPAERTFTAGSRSAPRSATPPRAAPPEGRFGGYPTGRPSYGTPSGTTQMTDVQVTIRMDKPERDDAKALLQYRVPFEAAETFAWPDAQHHQARNGRIYADVTALDRYFVEGNYNPTPIQLWQMQVNAWVQKDILAAIEKTNDEVLAPLPEDRRNVLSAAVKRLVEVRVARQYYTGEQTQATGMRDSMSGRGPSFGPPRKTGAAPGGATLTGHVSSKDFDVVHYGFVVVMPEQHVARLMKNLTSGTYHTVLTCEMASVEQPRPIVLPAEPERRDGDRRPRGEQRDAREYYYGPEPVVAVTLVGELLLQTDWARGKPHPEQKDMWLLWNPDKTATADEPWIVSDKPLVPPKALRHMLSDVREALRPADEKVVPTRSEQPTGYPMGR
ncbi:MAG: hypothetical protein KGY99_05095 [Phycisphaerae bacterium]|nr:hypothetical protein [Phycisphaerae bacterium]